MLCFLFQGAIQDLLIVNDSAAAYDHCNYYCPNCDVPFAKKDMGLVTDIEAAGANTAESNIIMVRTQNFTNFLKIV